MCIFGVLMVFCRSEKIVQYGINSIETLRKLEFFHLISKIAFYVPYSTIASATASKVRFYDNAGYDGYENLTRSLFTSHYGDMCTSTSWLNTHPVNDSIQCHTFIICVHSSDVIW